MKLTPAALVPVFSYAFSRGRTRCCGVHLSLSDPLFELTLGGLYTLSYAFFGFSIELPLLLLLLALLLALVRYDLMHQILPPSLLWPFVALAFLFALWRAGTLAGLFPTLAAAALLAALLALVHALSRGRAMGLADAPLSFGLALIAGWPLALSGFLYSFWIGAGIGIILLFLRPAGSRMRVEVPFAPFLAFGFLLAYFTQWNLFALSAALLPN